MAGGRLFQDVTGHGGEHEVITQEGEVVRVSSTHHQMMRVYGTEHELLAWSKPRSQVYRIGQTAPHIKPAETEKEPEAVFFNRINALAIQFHPEFYGPGNPCFDYAHRLIKAYVLEA
jgi:gamma-glutamyl-gamma-aminobutyrate hydrolase PuuD